MMKLMKRLTTLFILVFTLVVPITAAETDITDIGIAKYYTESVKKETYLRNGVYHITHTGYTSAIEGEVTDMGMGVDEEFVPNKYYAQQVSILDIPATSNASLIPWAYITDSAWNLETVGKIAKDYESKHPGEKVIAAVNGDFYDISGGKMYPYTPNNIHAANGDIFKSVHTNSAVGFLNDGSTNPLVGNKPIIRNAKPTLAIYDENDVLIKEFMIDQVNEEPNSNETSVLYPRYGVLEHQQPPKSISVDVAGAYIVHNGEYSIPYSGVPGIFGYESDSQDFFGKGIITDFGDGSLGPNDFAIKTNNTEVEATLKIGSKIRVQYEFTGDFENVDNIIGYNQAILYNGSKVGNIKQRAPRTMVGVKADGSYILSVVDGRQPDKGMYGATTAEMAAILTHYGAVEAYNLDGGGSSAMVVLDEQTDTFKVVNTYSDSKERPVSNALLVVVKNPVLEIKPVEITSSSIKLEVDVKIENGFNQDNLYVELNGEKKPVINNEVLFTNLNKQQNYRYEVYYKDNDTYIRLNIYDEIKTAKNQLILESINIYYEGNDLVFYLKILDSDNVFVSGKVILDDREVNIINGVAIFRGFKGSTFESFKPEIVYNLGTVEGEKTTEISDYVIYTEVDVLIDFSMNKFNNFYQPND